MKIAILAFLILLSGLLFGQADRITTGNLTTGDTTYTFFSAGREWVEIFLVDSLTTADTAVVEIQNPINSDWITLGVKDQRAEEFVSEMIPGVAAGGKLYVIWLMYPRKVRLRKTDVHNLTEKLYYGIQTKGNTE